MESITDIAALVRMFFIFGHLIAFAVAAAGIALGDLAVFADQHINPAQLRKAATLVACALGLLWVTGLAVVWLDTGFDPAVVGRNPKLLAKLSVVVVLTLNGMLLHRWAFPRMLAPPQQTRRLVLGLCVLGAVSSAGWLFAAFLGVAKALTRLCGYQGFIVGFALLLTAALAGSLALARPRLAARLALPYATRPGKRARR
jgi:hypothetical protein